ncbi:MAG: hypothetical protein OEY61_11645 [Gammaproteobacteria bacterium]|nr:hypothetical protein [Gammaproteobacteria bacterium]
MTKRALSSLFFILASFASTALLAERPAADEEMTTSAQTVEQLVNSEDEGRPAASDTIEVTEQHGDALSMPTEQSDVTTVVSVRTLDFPRRGMTQDKVQNELGRPVEIIPAVGKPPITRWVYDDRIVYFEYSSVIHVVAK